MLSTTVPIAALAVSLIVLYLVAHRRLHKPKRPPYPPGPAPSLIIGNLLDTPPTEAWLAYIKWGSMYGDVIHFTILGSHIVVLNSLDDIRELFEKRSNLYSDRPHMATIDLLGWGQSTAFLSYGGPLRKHRQFAQQAIIKHSSLSGFLPIVTKKVNTLLHSLLATPDDFMRHHKTFSASVVMAIVYGYDVAGVNDHFMAVADETMDIMTQAMLPGATMMNVLPVLRFIPPWFPGAVFQRLAVSGRKMAKEMQEVPFDMVQKQTADGTAAPSLVSNFIKESKSTQDYDLLKQACASLYGAGTDTTATALTTFFHAMIANPDVQAMAQREIENVVGNGRLPNFDDRPSLPYIGALLKELLRWRPVLPLCLPHSTRQNDVYKGYYIPKGTTILANIWAIYHDPRQYKDPHNFDPSRFLDENGELKDDNSEAHAFGFGRRYILPGKAPGVEFASILATFDIQAPNNAAGVRVLPPMDYADAMIPRPLPFSCSITPRASMSKVIKELQELRK